MVISDPTIDPITGLPLLNPSDVVQQIPLGVQAFPWQDMGATALPTRGPLYGDDILPVSAFVAGQHPQTGSAQTVQTDGAHALLVKDVGGGSGGTFGVCTPFSYNIVGQPVGLGFDVSIANITPPNHVFGGSFSFFVKSGVPTMNKGCVLFGLIGNPGGELGFLALPITTSILSGSGTFELPISYTLPAGFGGTSCDIVCTSPDCAIVVSGYLVVD